MHFSKSGISVTSFHLAFFGGARPRQRRPRGSPSPPIIRPYVKQLSWCTPPAGTAAADQKSCLPSRAAPGDDTGGRPDDPPVAPFGIIAAAAHPSHVIGLGGSVPWEAPEDRRYFEAATRGRILVMGRHTFAEGGTAPSFRRVVVSRTMDGGPGAYGDDVVVARSFREALRAAADAADAEYSDCWLRSGGAGGVPSEHTDFDTWVIGGEKIYEEALRHPSAEVLHLTKIGTDESFYGHLIADRKEGGGAAIRSVAKFPRSYTWDVRYDEVIRKNMTEPAVCAIGESISEFACSLHVYRRKRRPGINDTIK